MYVTVPLPDPVEPEVIVSHGTLLNAVHAQPDTTVTLTVRVDADAPTDALAGESVASQAAAAWLTVKTRPAIVSEPLREVAVVFSATL